jgi:hypothetical protein
MKKKLSVMTALVLALVMAVSTVAFARPMETVPQREVDGVVYVPLRQTLEAYGWTLERERESGTVHLINPFGAVDSFYFNELLEITMGFVENGVTWIPHDMASLIFDPLYEMMNNFELRTFTLCEEARDLALDDFLYMISFILNNSPWDSVVYRAFGIDFIELAEFYQGMIETMEPFSVFTPHEEFLRTFFPLQDGDSPREKAANYLFALLLYGFASELMAIGHMMPRTLDMYIAQYTGFTRAHYRADAAGESTLLLEKMFGAFADPAAVWLYGEVEVDLYSDELPIPVVHGNIETAMLDDEAVAFLRINSFGANMEHDDAILLPFLQEIADAEHLIIDLRGNGGGFVRYGMDLLLRRLINEPIEYSTFEFFAGGDEAYAKMNTLLKYASEMETILYAEIMPAEEFIAERGKVYFDANDLARLDYVIVSREVITPADDAVGFGGKIWLLVDGESASLSAMLAEIALYTGFATVVGENTSHVMGSTNLYVALPNTGIIWRVDIGYKTDALGRSLEVFGVTPNILNFSGLDAFDTVLLSILLGDNA